MRAGGQTLTLLGAPRTFLILQSLAEGPKGQLELRRDAGAPAQSTLRGHLRALEATGAVAKRRRDSFPGALEYELTECGRELLSVAGGLERWLAGAPAGPLELGNDPAKAAVKGLVDGWSTSILGALATGPLSLTELDKRISTVSYPTIERCLENMRLADQLEVGTRGRSGTPHAITDWLRRGVAPLALGARWEHRFGSDGADPVSRADLGGALQLAEPLFNVSQRLSGSCQIELKPPHGDADGQEHFFAVVEVASGKLSLGGFYPEVEPDVQASGSIASWFSTVIDADTTDLELKGDRDLAKAIFSGLHRALFKGVAKKSPAHSSRSSLTS